MKSTKYIKIVYNMMLHDMDQAANAVNWATLVRHLLLSLGFYEVWLNQGVGNYKSFLSLLKQRLTDTFIQNWLARLGESTHADFYKTFARFQMQPYLEKVNILREKSLAIYFEDSQFIRIRTFNFIVSKIYVDKRSRV